MYGDHHYGKRESRPLSFLPSSDNTIETFVQPIALDSSKSYAARNALSRTTSNGKVPAYTNGQSKLMAARTNSFGHENGSLSPSVSLREQTPSTTANSQFPLNDLEYESNPAAVAQELSNLQALRRMSMDVNATGDPDLPTFSSGFGMPTVAPTGATDEGDASRLFWVPARVHPELAPMEFKAFLDSRVDSIKRRSGDGSLSPDNPQRQGSGGGLRRKKSMLSRQIDNSGGRAAEGYTDGAERLDRKRSLSAQDTPNTGITNLQELEVLVNDPVKIIQRLSLDTELHAVGGEVPASEDMPILPAAPSGNSLRRSTRTTYRRGSLRKGERVPYSKRAAKAAETDSEETPTSPKVSSEDMFTLSRIQTEPTPNTEKVPENFSRPSRLNRNRVIAPGSSPKIASPETPSSQSLLESPDKPGPAPPVPKHFVSQIASNGRATISPHILGQPVPQIIQTPPPVSPSRDSKPFPWKANLPERTSSHEVPPSKTPQGPLSNGPPHGTKRQTNARSNHYEAPNQTLKEMASHPSPLPGNSTRTDSLSFIPTFADEKKVEGKKPRDKKDKESKDGERKSSWSWGSLLGSEEREKEKRKEEEAKEARKAKLKPSKPIEKSHDNTRLDLLQMTMEGSRGRESLVLERGDVKLEEERKKESIRKTSGGDNKKEKESGLFSSFFGGGKKKGDRELNGKKHLSNTLSPEPPPRILKPDVDYNWTRFSILEERAIYRMAHIKLANPRRALQSQVLLSNFMYSYLAKVQQMHPQMQTPPTQVQKQHQMQTQQRKSDQPEEYYQYQKYQEASLRYPAAANKNTDNPQQQQQQQEQGEAQAKSSGHAQHDGPENGEDAQYDHHRTEQDSKFRPQPRAGQQSNHGVSNGIIHDGQGNGNHHHRPQQYHRPVNVQQTSPYQHQQSQFSDPGKDDDDDMW